MMLVWVWSGCGFNYYTSSLVQLVVSVSHHPSVNQAGNIQRLLSLVRSNLKAYNKGGRGCGLIITFSARGFPPSPPLINCVMYMDRVWIHRTKSICDLI